jgi:orotidine 5'-phosphate decarboxylase subfamily 2
MPWNQKESEKFMPFSDKLRDAQQRANSWLCVGLDTDPAKIPSILRSRKDAVLAFNRAIVDVTHDLVCAYKPNLAFYLAQKSAGIDALFETCSAIPREIPVILDAKFGDIVSSARGYAQFAFRELNADAVTVSPYLGADALAPFLDYGERAIFILCHTSNPGASDLQEALVATPGPEAIPEPLYLRVARLAGAMPGRQVGLVVGATFPEQLSEARAANPQAVFLIPGIGSQGGSLAEAVRYGENGAGIGPIINASRTILYASDGADFAQAARAAAVKMRDEINALKRK